MGALERDDDRSDKEKLKMTTTSEVGITDSKMIIDEACRTAKAFIDRFYDKVDSKRPTLAKIYLDAATLSWNGNRIDGPEDIQKFYQEKLPPPSHQIYSYDAQPVMDEFVGGQKTVVVHVGEVSSMEQRGRDLFSRIFF